MFFWVKQSEILVCTLEASTQLQNGTYIHIIIYTYIMGVSKNKGTQQPWIFLLEMIILGCEMGVPSFKETPISTHIHTKKQIMNIQIFLSPRCHDQLQNLYFKELQHPQVARFSSDTVGGRNPTRKPVENTSQVVVIAGFLNHQAYYCL